MSKVLLTGATGFLGHHVLPVLEETYGKDAVVAVGSAAGDLTEPSVCRNLVQEVKPEIVVHLAAYSGGIGANKAFPADFYHINTLLTANMFRAAAEVGVKKLVYPMGGCAYPADALSPIGEAQLFRGYPQAESAGYSMAKAMGVVAARSYQQQYGMHSVVLIPGNMYGEFDNFRENESHVVPAMVRRFYEAMKAGVDEVTMWGTGSPERDFVYAADVAATFPYFIEEYEGQGPINISSGTRVSIRELTEIIVDITGFKGAVKWDTTKPDGQKVKIFDTQQMEAEGLACPTSLRRGLENTIEWFAANYEAGPDTIRL